METTKTIASEYIRRHNNKELPILAHLPSIANADTMLSAEEMKYLPGGAFKETVTVVKPDEKELKKDLKELGVI